MAGFLTKLRGFFGDRSGNATIEFVLIFPAFMSFFLMSVEVGVLTLRGVLLDRAMDVLVRDLRLGNFQPESHQELKEEFCSNGIVFAGCEDAIVIELTPFEFTDETLGAAEETVCRDREQDLDPAVQFDPGVQNEMVMIRACLLFEPFFPAGRMAAQLKRPGTDEYALVTISAFVNEP